MTVTMMLDLMLAALLVATIVYAVILNRRLGALRDGREEMRALIADFTAATEKARAGMDELRAASDVSGRGLKEMIEESRALREDLGFLIERGGVVADRLEGGVRGARRAGEAAHDAARAPSNSNPAPSNSNDDPVQKLRRILEATR